jgi:2'-5' RNA ligase
MAGKIKNKRLFLALLLPEEALSFLSSLFQKLPGRPQAKENLHLTLFFFGQASSQEEGKIKEAFSKVALEEKPFTFSFADLSFFPSSGRPRGIWVKVGGRDEERLFSFRQRLGEEFLARNISFDQKPFLPHLTLTRFSQKEKIFKRDLPKVAFGKFLVSSIGLFESRLSKRGADYFLIKEVKLEPGA